jgi:tetratricopeptide (TPR) repeat protein
MTAAVQRTQDDRTLIKAQVVIDLVERLIELDERFVTLLPDRAELQDTRGHFDDSLADLQRYIKSPAAVIDSGVLLKVGVLLMSLGNWGTSRRVLRITRQVAGDRREQVMARFFELWIDDYQRSRRHVVRECLALLSEAAELGDPSLASMVEHRLGRTIFAASLESHNSGMMEESLRRFKSAKRRDEQATGFAQPYHDMWIARAAEALATRDRSIRFEQAREAAEEIGGGWVAHVDLSEAHRAMRLGKWFKAKLLLLDAMKRWKPLPYPKGVFDVSHMLGRTCRELKEDDEASTYLWLAVRLGSRLRLPIVNEARGLFERTVQARGVSREYAITLAEEKLTAQSFSRILKGWRFTIPTWKLNGSEILPVAKEPNQD